ncbi:pyruvate ferredoxin oxidoreductase [Prevotella brunnea]|uniref:Pyruvate ferredoxin oxidoreductase n=1 Tax=Prevotella brunnea TaxID=2508867 RepID=A0A5C8GJC5_9BACT|nr:pyruvate ferredoxin oxidoreductase [Prevotella brunnea]MDR0187000.1 pyruvate ferredoxin oxidoreductase [Prevotella brunnea]TXJ62106.1 pyruvate ferredoxin oxidoreductase [Prevotella brunnea]
MDYKYIEQLMERYWRCETTLHEEDILRTFFSQEDVPAEFLPYKDLFVYGREQKESDALDDEFDRKVLGMIREDEPVKARTITMRQRLIPLFKAAAVVAIVLTLGNAIQTAIQPKDAQLQQTEVANTNQTREGLSVAKADSTHSDSLQSTTSQPQQQVIIK